MMLLRKWGWREGLPAAQKFGEECHERDPESVMLAKHEAHNSSQMLVPGHECMDKCKKWPDFLRCHVVQDIGRGRHAWSRWKVKLQNGSLISCSAIRNYKSSLRGLTVIVFLQHILNILRGKDFILSCAGKQNKSMVEYSYRGKNGDGIYSSWILTS